jgi:MFS family permease
VRPAQPGGSSRRRDLRQNLSSSLVDAGSFSVMVGCGETYFPAFALALGLSQVSSGLVATLPLLIGSLLQLAAPFLLRRFGSYRRWVVLCVLCQAATFVALIALALERRIPATLLFVVAAVYWAAGLGTGPAWNTWIGTLVPVGIRARFFAWRTRIVQAGTLLGFVIGGLALQFGARSDAALISFAGLFAVAGLCRFLSGAALSRQTEPTPPGDDERHVSLREFASRFGRLDGKFLLYLMAIQAAVQLSGPYFTPFMLKQLHLSYASYMVLVASAFGAKMLALPWLGHLAHRYGARRLIVWGSIGIVPLASGWLVSDHYAWLLVLQAVGGVAWAAYELSWFLLFFEMLPREERTSVLTTFNFGHSLASVVGSLVGGAVLLTLGEQRHVYLGLFAASTLLRIVVVARMLPRFGNREPTPVGSRRRRTTHSVDIAATAPHAPGLTVGSSASTGSGPSATLR